MISNSKNYSVDSGTECGGRAIITQLVKIVIITKELKNVF